MKKIILVVLVILFLFTSFMFASKVFAQEADQKEYPSPPISEKDIIEFVEKVGVQVRIPVKQVYRALSFYKFEEGSKFTDEEIKALSEDEKIWYEQGYIVKYGEWIGDDKDEEDQIVEVAIYGSGTIIYSAELPEALQSQDKGIYAETLVMTNYHVIQPLVDKLNLGTKVDPLNVYEARDLKTSIDPPKVEMVAGARPISQKYSYLVDKEGKPIKYWSATTNVASIKIKADQNYDIEATVVGYDKGLDVGILSIKNVAFQPYAIFRKTECQVGEKVWIRHAPMAMRFSTDRGYVNQTHLDLGVDEKSGIGWMDQVKLDIPSAPGSSGSGIFDENGFLVALFHGGLIHQMGEGYSFIEGGHLAHEGSKVAEWLNWKGFSYIFLKPPYKDQLEILEKGNIEFE